MHEAKIKSGMYKEKYTVCLRCTKIISSNKFSAINSATKMCDDELVNSVNNECVGIIFSYSVAQRKCMLNELNFVTIQS